VPHEHEHDPPLFNPQDKNMSTVFCLHTHKGIPQIQSQSAFPKPNLHINGRSHDRSTCLPVRTKEVMNIYGGDTRHRHCHCPLPIANDVMMPLEAHSKEACRTRDATRTSSWMLSCSWGCYRDSRVRLAGRGKAQGKNLNQDLQLAQPKLAQNSERAHQARSII
jgi:hypothetical protein